MNLLNKDTNTAMGMVFVLFKEYGAIIIINMEFGYMALANYILYVIVLDGLRCGQIVRNALTIQLINKS